MQVPFESLKRTSRDRKYIIDDLQSLVSAVKEAAGRQCSEEERADAVAQLIAQLTSIRGQVGVSAGRLDWWRSGDVGLGKV